MDLIPNIEQQLMSLSRQLDRSPETLTDALVLGLVLEGQVDHDRASELLSQLGFSRQGSLWLRCGEAYEASSGTSESGYLTTGEIDQWRLSLVDRCREDNVSICLPAAHEILNTDNQALAGLLNNLMAITPALSVRFSGYESAQEQAAMYVALQLLGWPQVWRLLFEELRVQNRLDEPNISATVATLFNEHDIADIVAILNALEDRMGMEKSESANPGIQQLREKITEALKRFRISS